MNMKNVFLKFGLAAVVLMSSGIVAGNGSTFAAQSWKDSPYVDLSKEELREKIDKYKDKISNIENVEESDKVKKLKKKVKKLKSKIAELKDEEDGISVTVDEFKRYGRLERKCEKLNEDIEGFKSEVSELSKKKNKLKEKAQNLYSKYRKASKKNKELDRTLEKRGFDNIKVQNDKLKSEKEDYLKAIKDSEAERSGLEAESKRLQEALNAERKRNADLNEELKQQSRRPKGADSRKLVEKNENLKKSLAHYEEELSKLDFNNLDQKLKDLINGNMKLRNKVERSRAKIDELSKKVHDLENPGEQVHYDSFLNQWIRG